MRRFRGNNNFASYALVATIAAVAGSAGHYGHSATAKTKITAKKNQRKTKGLSNKLHI